MRIYFRLTITFALTAGGLATAQPDFGSWNSAPGAFSRMGFGARGAAMGNAMAAVAHDDATPYYNPAIAVLTEGHRFNASYSLLSLDRTLNTLIYSKRFDFYGRGVDPNEEGAKPRAAAGFSAGLINAGVANIDGRDAHGYSTGELSTSENLVFVAMAMKLSDKLQAGVLARLYYFDLYEEFGSTTVGVDLGAMYHLTPDLVVAFVVADFNSVYRWDSAELYDMNGAITEDRFPERKTLAVSYRAAERKLTLAGEFSFDNMGGTLFRAGVEYEPIERLVLRGGVDNWRAYTDEPARPSLGFGYSYDVGGVVAGIDYAWVSEPYSPEDRHVVGISASF
ncbi:MAG: hypothetical protein GF419_10490 [Ignavibacteriales bacterium]|nr:hypothetical protein [Ignavibacteriales bacterium]